MENGGTNGLSTKEGVKETKAQQVQKWPLFHRFVSKWRKVYFN